MNRIFSVLVLSMILLGIGAISYAAKEIPDFKIESKATRDLNHAVRVEFAAVYPSSEESFWALVRDYSSYPQFVPNVSDAELLGKLEGRDRVYLEAEMPALIPNVWSILDVTLDKEQKVLEWRMRKGNMTKNQGVFRLKKVEEGIKLVGEASVDPGSFIPNRLVVWASKHYTPRLLRAFGKELLRRKAPIVQEASAKKAYEIDG